MPSALNSTSWDHAKILSEFDSSQISVYLFCELAGETKLFSLNGIWETERERFFHFYFALMAQKWYTQWRWRRDRHIRMEIGIIWHKNTLKVVKERRRIWCFKKWFLALSSSHTFTRSYHILLMSTIWWFSFRWCHLLFLMIKIY